MISSDARELVREAPLNMGQSILGQMLMGNSYSTPPRRYFRFNVALVNGVSRVQASGWMELQMAFGQIKRTDFAGPEFQNNVMGFMASAGGKYPVGTRFPNHVMMGIQIQESPQGKYAGLRVTTIEPGSAAEKGGMQTGDIVVRIAKKRFKNIGDYLDATAKAAEAPDYDVEVLRGGASVTLKLERAYRPIWTEVVVAKSAPATTAPAMSVAAVPSVADELRKLAKLKEDGILSDGEFEAQKKKLLGL